MPILLWIIAGALTLLGGAGLWLGLRGKRLNDHPICRKCKFDLVGVYAPHDANTGGTGVPPVRTNDDNPRCPECGRDLSRRRAVRRGARRKRPVIVTISALSLLLGAGALSTAVWGRATDFNWNRVKPEWMLLAELHTGETSVDRAILVEFARRLRQRGLSDRTLIRLAPTALEIQKLAVQRHPQDLNSLRYNAQWGDIATEAVLRGLVSDHEAVQYAKRGVMARVRVRSPMPAGAPLRVSVSPDINFVGWPQGAGVHYEVVKAAIGDAHFETAGAHGVIPFADNHGGGRTFTLPGTLNPTGEQEVQISIRWRLHANCPTSYDVHDHSDAPAAQWTEQYARPILIQLPHVPDVVLVDDAAMAPQMVNAAQVVTVRLLRSPSNSPQFRIRAQFTNLPAGLAHEASLRTEDREWPLRVVRANIGETAYLIGDFDASEFDASLVDLVLRPSLKDAIRSIDVHNLWNREIVIPGIPVQDATEPLESHESRLDLEVKFQESIESVQSRDHRWSSNQSEGQGR